LASAFAAILAPVQAVIHAASMEAFLQAFAALGTVVGGIGAYAGFLSLLWGDEPSAIGEATTVGAAIGFLPGLVIAVLVFAEVAGQSQGIYGP
jgi:hypothetical protein